MTFVQKLKHLMSAAGLSQPRLAKKLETSSGTVNGWLTKGARPNPSTSVRLAEFFGVSVDWLLDDKQGTAEELRRAVTRVVGFPTPPEDFPMRPFSALEYSHEEPLSRIEKRIKHLYALIEYLEKRFDYQVGPFPAPLKFEKLPPAAQREPLINELEKQPKQRTAKESRTIIRGDAAIASGKGARASIKKGPTK